MMKELAREGMTMVVVTHEMGFAREVGIVCCLWNKVRLWKKEVRSSCSKILSKNGHDPFYQRCCNLVESRILLFYQVY